MTINGLTFHYVQAGRGPTILLLHGFPEFWYCWRHQIPVLAEAGFHVLAPDLRGYNDSDRPAGMASYRLSLLSADVAGLIQQAGPAPAVVVGHDWGGLIAWHLAATRPDLMSRLIVLNAPHPAAFLRELRRGPGQWLRSAYILFFQIPWLPERVLSAGGHALLRRVLRRQPVRSGAFRDEDIRRYQQALARPGALTAALNYYRALLRYPGQALRGVHPIAVPTLLLWGEKDPYLSVGMTEGLQRWVTNLQVARLPHAGHWLPSDAPEEVNARILRFLRGA
jgi:pimeloyl-ACP methyl ester carboxylesterase